jgi:hypothetical protein
MKTQLTRRLDAIEEQLILSRTPCSFGMVSGLDGNSGTHYFEVCPNGKSGPISQDRAMKMQDRGSERVMKINFGKR